MDGDKILKSAQEQAVASWIEYLNQQRLAELYKSLAEQDLNLADALKYLDDALATIRSSIIETNRGGARAMHGFIAEVAEVGIGNARQRVVGERATHQWVNDNGPVDIIRDGIGIQQKFYQSGDGLSLGAILEHLKQYPDYLKQGGKYQIPRDQYDKIVYLLGISEEQANKMPTSDGSFSLRQWKYVHEFFEKGDVKFESIEPAALDYKDAQAGAVSGALDREKANIKEKDESVRGQSYKKSKPSLRQGAQATVVSSLTEGGLIFVTELYKKIRQKKQISNLSDDDWKEILQKSGIGFAEGGIRGASVYALSNYTATPAAVASAIVTSGIGVANQVRCFRSGKIDEVELIENSEILCLDAAVSALFSVVGQIAVPVPVFGAIIGNTVGMVLYQNAKEYYFGREREIIDGYLESIQRLDSELSQDYRQTVVQLRADFEIFFSLLTDAFSPDPLEALDGSVALAKRCGVPDDEILSGIPEIDRYFLS